MVQTMTAPGDYGGREETMSEFRQRQVADEREAARIDWSAAEARQAGVPLEQRLQAAGIPPLDPDHPVVRWQLARIAELEALLVEEQQARHKAGTELAALRRHAGLMSVAETSQRLAALELRADAQRARVDSWTERMLELERCASTLQAIGADDRINGLQRKLAELEAKCRAAGVA
jgi:hypothetical protein